MISFELVFSIVMLIVAIVYIVFLIETYYTCVEIEKQLSLFEAEFIRIRSMISDLEKRLRK